ncbi:Uncharacterised protein [Iodobacter fluviatilis]|uniref:Polysaccharide biosynthesis protein n=1 Tax=Iodobacter fluviatilis TaxID=537 RepID=A0A377SVY4_9NEIS|nr:hypothetical protein [Iodobacter fluviatilis]STR45480.1 Uncharacterised protein [Iodobacter fluviatilis]
MLRYILNMLITLLSAVSAVIASIYLSRFAVKYLNTSDLEIWFLMVASIPFINLLDLGASVICPRQIALARVASIKNKLNVVIKTYLVSVVVILFLFFVFVSIGLTVSSHYFWRDSSLYWVLIFFIAASLFRVLGNAIQSIVFSLDMNIYDKLIKLFASIIVAGFASGFLNSGMGLYSIPFAWCIATFFTSVVSMFLIKKITPNLWGTSKYDYKFFLEVKGPILQYLCTAIPGLLVFNLTPYMIAYSLASEYTIQFSLVQQVVNAVLIASSISTIVLTPKLSKLFIDNKKQMKKLVFFNVELVGSVSLLAFLFLYLNIDYIISLWINKEIHIDKIFLIIYFLGVFLEVQQTSLTSICMTTGYYGYSKITIKSAILVICTMLPFISWVGLPGAALSIVISQLLTCHPHNFKVAIERFELGYLLYIKSFFRLIILGGGII